MSADIRTLGTLPDGRTVKAARLSAGEVSVVVLTWGAVLQDVRLAGAPWSLTLGADQVAGYADVMDSFGAIVGPVANRIGGAQAVIAGKLHQFPPNEGTSLLHGGTHGTQRQNWEILAADSTAVTLRLVLADGDQGFPGRREIIATYALSAPADLTLTLQATTDAPTLMNLAQHSYWNLDGQGTVAGHRLRVAGGTYLPTTANLPTGERRAVCGVFDLRAGRILDLSEGYDHNFCLAEAPMPLSEVAELTGRKGVRLRLSTTEPGLQVYDGSGLTSGPYLGHAGQVYRPYHGIAIEAQRWPDAPNHPGFPGIGLRPGDTYEQVTRFSFDRIGEPPSAAPA